MGDQGVIGVFLESVEGPCRTERNWLAGFRMGIAIGQEAGGGIYESDGLGSTVIGNLILRSGRIEGGSALLYGIDIAADHCLVRDNLLRYRSALFGGIRSTGSHGRIEGNLLFSRAGSQPGMDDFPVGIMVGVSDADGFLAGADTVVRGNRLVGVQDAVWVAHSEGVQVLNNRIEAERGELRHGVLLADTERSRVEGNRITNAQRGIWVTGFEAGNRILDNEILDGGTGIGAVNQGGLQVARNRVNRMRVTGFGGGFLWGTTSLSENRFVSCGTGDAEGVGGPAIGVLFSFGPLVVESNEVLNTGIAPDGAQLQMATFGILGLLIDECRIQSNLVTYEPPLIRDPKAPDRALLLMGLYEFEIADRVFGGSAQILDNQFTGPSTESLVQIVGWKLTENFFLRFERVFFSNNHVWHWAGPEGVSVKLTGRRASVMGNHVKNTSGAPSFDLDDVRTTYMGNHAMGGIIGSANVRPVAINDFNFEF
jgi:parallel beta-helix repeat protein